MGWLPIDLPNLTVAALPNLGGIALLGALGWTFNVDEVAQGVIA